MFEVTAHHILDDTTTIGGVKGYAVFETEAARDAELARYPKWVNLKKNTMTAQFDGVNYTRRPCISFDARFYAQTGNPANETGAKRVRRFLSLAQFEYKTLYKNSYATLDDALAALPA